MAKFVDITGRRFRLLTVVEYVGNSKWLCNCDCGKTRIADAGNLKAGGTGSCGCLHKKIVRRPPGYSAYRLLWNICRGAANARNIEFNLTQEEHKAIVIQNCRYCNAEPRDYNPYVGVGKRSEKAYKYDQKAIDMSWVKANGVDRIMSEKGYTVENCVPCCAQCNTMKMKYSHFDFISQVARIYHNQDWNLAAAFKNREFSTSNG